MLRRTHTKRDDVDENKTIIGLKCNEENTKF